MEMPMIMQPMYLYESYGLMLPGVKKIACGLWAKSSGFSASTRAHAWYMPAQIIAARSGRGLWRQGGSHRDPSC